MSESVTRSPIELLWTAKKILSDSHRISLSEGEWAGEEALNILKHFHLCLIISKRNIKHKKYLIVHCQKANGRGGGGVKHCNGHPVGVDRLANQLHLRYLYSNLYLCICICALQTNYTSSNCIWTLICTYVTIIVLYSYFNIVTDIQFKLTITN